MRQIALVLLHMAAITGRGALQAGTLDIVNPKITHFMQRVIRDQFVMPYTSPPSVEEWRVMSVTDRLADVRSRLMPELPVELASKQLKLGQAAFIRIFKETHELELWLRGTDNQWKLFRNYPIATFSGTLGPKTREGDMQAPEGFYFVTPTQLNPASSYHLSFNIGYPNKYDLAHQRTGSLIMIHGDNVSVGCFAMTDPLIEEIYLLIEAALKSTSTVPIHIFPFRMEERRMKVADPKHLDFWRELHSAYNIFEKERRVPEMTVENGRYRVN